MRNKNFFVSHRNDQQSLKRGQDQKIFIIVLLGLVVTFLVVRLIAVKVRKSPEQ